MAGEVGNLSDSASEERARSRARCSSSLLCDPLAALLQRVEVGGFVDNERAPPAVAFRHPIAFELSVGLNDGAWG